MPGRGRISNHAWFFLVALVLTAILYFPGLSGSWLFDDYPNIVDNPAIHIATSSSAAWLNAMWASPATELQRPLASLSFALNDYLNGLNPWSMKATNLAIHLLNGWLLYLLLSKLVTAAGATERTEQPNTWLPALVAAAWLLHPINVSAVLYVVQRMESLAQVFVLAGLLVYVEARIRQQQERAGAPMRLWLGVPVCMALGIASKESAVMLPLYALLLEFMVFREVRHGRTGVLAFFTGFLVIPGLIGATWLLHSGLLGSAYAHQAFSLGERLLTEPRVLVDYVLWTLLPAPGFFSFYRDDYLVSTSLWQPWTTLPAMALLAALLVAAWLLRRRRPLAALGIAWFFAAHVLTATVIPLELVFEHRNYFASTGLLLAAFDLLLPRADTIARLAPIRVALVCSVVALAALSLSLRARVWGNPVTFAVTEAARHPLSPRATYDLGRIYVVLSGYRADSPLVPRAIAALDAAAAVPSSRILPEVALIMLASRTNLPEQDAWWDSMVHKLEARPPSAEDAGAIKALTSCQREGRCKLDDQHMLAVYLAAVTHDPPDPGVLYSYAIFAFNRLHDTDLALRLTRDAARSHDPQYQLNLVNFLIDLQRWKEAQTELGALRLRIRPGKMESAIANAGKQIDAGMSQSAASHF
ncbi:MAG: hypothetical protein ABI365_07235 [Lysobacteraceae bacterium]